MYYRLNQMRKKTEEEIYMRKDKKREIFDAVLTKALGVDYSEFLVSLSGSCKIPKNFPGEYGVDCIMKGFPPKVLNFCLPGYFLPRS